MTSPSASSVSVEKPIVTSPSYTFPASSMYSRRRVALPTATGRTPVTCGSSVPPWPIFFVFKIPRSLATTSKDVQPASLYTFKIPFIDT